MYQMLGERESTGLQNSKFLELSRGLKGNQIDFRALRWDRQVFTLQTRESRSSHTDV